MTTHLCDNYLSKLLKICNLYMIYDINLISYTGDIDGILNFET